MSGISLTLPHMGWNQVDCWPRNEKSEILCRGFNGNGSHFYFVHSFIFKTEDSKNVLMTSYYAEKFTCAVNKENIFGKPKLFFNYMTDINDRDESQMQMTDTIDRYN